MKKILFLLCAVFIALALLSLFSEGLLRFVFPKSFYYLPPLWKSDSVLVFKMKPNLNTSQHSSEYSVSIRTDSTGFRKRNKKKRNEKDKVILNLGDSFVFGYGVESDETFSAILEKKLDERGVSSHVYNLGVPMWGTAQEIIFLYEYALQYNPNEIFIYFFANDFSDNMNYQSRFYLAPDKVRSSIWEMFYSYRYVKSRLKHPKKERDISKEFGFLYWDLLTPFKKNHFFELEQAYGVVDSLAVLTKGFTETTGIPVSFVYVPMAIERGAFSEDWLAPYFWNDKIKAYYRENPLDFKQVRHRLKKIFKSRRIGFYVWDGERTNLDDLAEYYYKKDRHLTVKGHEALAEYLCPILEKKLRKQGKNAMGPLEVNIMENYRRVIRGLPRRIYPEYDKINRLLRQRDYSGVMKTARCLLDKYGNSLFTRYQLAKAAHSMGYDQLAYEEYQRVLKDNPEFLRARLNMAYICCHLKKHVEAAEHFDFYEKILNGTDNDRYLWAKCLLMAGKPVQSVMVFDKVADGDGPLKEAALNKISEIKTIFPKYFNE